MSKKMTKSKLWGIVASASVVGITTIATASTVLINKNYKNTQLFKSNTILNNDIEPKITSSSEVKSLKVGGFNSSQNTMAVNILQNTKFANLKLSKNLNYGTQEGNYSYSGNLPQQQYIFQDQSGQNKKSVILSVLNNNGQDIIVAQDANTLELINFSDISSNSNNLDSLSLSGYKVRNMVNIDGTDTFGIFLANPSSNKVLMANFNFNTQKIEFSLRENQGLVDLSSAINMPGSDSIANYYISATPKLNDGYDFKRGFSFVNVEDPTKNYFLETYWFLPGHTLGTSGDNANKWYLGFDLTSPNFALPTDYVSYMDAIYLLSNNNSGEPYSWVKVTLARNSKTEDYKLYTTFSNSNDSNAYTQENRTVTWNDNVWRTWTTTNVNFHGLNPSVVGIERPKFAYPLNVFNIDDNTKKLVWATTSSERDKSNRCAVALSFDIQLLNDNLTVLNPQVKTFNTKNKGVNGVIWTNDGMILNLGKNLIQGSAGWYVGEQEILKISSSNWLNSQALNNAITTFGQISNTVSNNQQSAMANDSQIKNPLFVVMPLMQGSNYKSSASSSTFDFIASELKANSNYLFNSNASGFEFQYNTKLKGNSYITIKGLKNPFISGDNSQLESNITNLMAKENAVIENALYNPVLNSRYSVLPGTLKYLSNDSGNQITENTKSGFVMKINLTSNQVATPKGIDSTQTDLGSVELWDGNFYLNPDTRTIDDTTNNWFGQSSQNYDAWLSYLNDASSPNPQYKTEFDQLKKDIASRINQQINRYVSHPSALIPRIDSSSITIKDLGTDYLDPADKSSKLVGKFSVSATFNDWYENGAKVTKTIDDFFTVILNLSLSPNSFNILFSNLFQNEYGENGQTPLTSLNQTLLSEKVVELLKKVSKNTSPEWQAQIEKLQPNQIAGIDPNTNKPYVEFKKISGGNYQVYINSLPGFNGLQPTNFFFDPANVKAPLGLILGISIPVALIVLIAIIVTVVLIKKRKNNVQSAA